MFSLIARIYRFNFLKVNEMAKVKKESVEKTPVITAYKGFDKNWKCRDFQYEVGKDYEHKGKVKACNSGFHACENPFDVWNYYVLNADNKFAIVEMGGEISRDTGDSKIASAKIHIKAEIGIPEIISSGVNFVMSLVKASKETTATTGEGANAATTGEGANAATTGYKANAATTGEGANAATTGEGANAATTGEHSVSAALGINSKAKAGIGGAIVLVYRNLNGDLIHIKSSKVGENGIKPDVWYTLNESGDFVEYGK